MFCVGPTCQLTPKVFSLCRPCFPLYYVTSNQLLFSNAMSLISMTDDIPIVYYGQEHGMHGNSDPYNRETLWPSGYQNTTAVRLIAKLNTLRQWMIKTNKTYLTQRKSILSSTATGSAIQNGSVISVITNIDSPVRDWRSFRDVADFNVLLAAKYQHACLYSLQAQRPNHRVSISTILCSICLPTSNLFSILSCTQYAFGSEVL